MDSKGINCSDAQLECLWFLTKTSQKQDIKWFEKSSPNYTSRYRKKNEPNHTSKYRETHKSASLLDYKNIVSLTLDFYECMQQNESEQMKYKKMELY